MGWGPLVSELAAALTAESDAGETVQEARGQSDAQELYYGSDSGVSGSGYGVSPTEP